jgi:uncharacterized membrane protein (Fun14 family)
MISTATKGLISSGFQSVGGGAIGFAVGYALKKIMKPAFIGLGLLMLLIGYLEYQRWITVNWTTVESESSAFMTHAANKVVAVTSQMGHSMPIGLGAAGFVPGLIAGILKG